MDSTLPQIDEDAHVILHELCRKAIASCGVIAPFVISSFS